ncbi:hypothetical protein ACLB2K_025053 [Fragaria x ananassa]
MKEATKEREGERSRERKKKKTDLNQGEKKKPKPNTVHGNSFIPAAIFNLSALQVINLSYNQLSGSIPREMGNLTTLKEIYLDNNNFIEIPNEIGSLHQLEKLYVQENALEGNVPMPQLDIWPQNSEYGTEGIVTRRGDLYSFGVVLMETFTRKKPTDEMFVAEMSLKQWVANSPLLDVVDTKLQVTKADDRDFVYKSECLSSIMRLALA